MISRTSCIGGTVSSGGGISGGRVQKADTEICGGAIPTKDTDIKGTISYPDKGLGGEVDKPQAIYVKELEFKTYREFPAVGNSEFLYIDTQTNTIYRFDAEQNIYVSCGRDMDDVETIICKSREE